MTKKDYELIASAIKDTRKQFTDFAEDTEVIDAVTKKLADKLATDNPRFQRGTFLEAAGV